GTSVGEILKTTDGGNNWNLLFTSLSSNPVDAMFFTSASTGWFTSLNETYSTNNGGNIWGRELKFNKDQIFDIDTLNSSTVLSAGGGYGCIFRRQNSLSYTISADTLCTDNSYSVNITPIGTWNAGNQFVIELSDDFGDFTFPYILGSGSASGSTSITFNLPNGLTDGTDYRIRIYSSDPPMWSYLNSTHITIRTSPDAFVNPGGPTTFCQGDSVTLFALTDPLWTYQWFVDGNIIPNATTDQLVVSATGDYTVLVSDGVCSMLSEITDILVDNCTGLGVISDQSGFIVAPNPASDRCIISNRLGHTIDLVQIYDLAGRLIQSQRPENNLQINLDSSTLASGNYIIRLTGSITASLKLTKQ
ncbi:MAG: T9SS type A sorting domain-containing protein, partial [Bacteroidota bacterium]